MAEQGTDTRNNIALQRSQDLFFNSWTFSVSEADSVILYLYSGIFYAYYFKSQGNLFLKLSTDITPLSSKTYDNNSYLKLSAYWSGSH